MIIIPAIDIRQGNCVMLKQGRIEDETIYSKDPVFIAKLWQAKGAERLHVIDLDGAFTGNSQNLKVIQNICENIKIPVQIGGGVRKLDAIDTLFSIGASYVILGTVAVYNPDIVRKAVEKYGSKIIVALDTRDGKVAIGGWKDTTSIDAIDQALLLKKDGVEEILSTDIKKDGMLEGPNIAGLKDLAVKSGLKIIASGGVTTLEDISKLKEIEKYGITSAIIGKALYTEDIKLEDAIKQAK